jgi:multidrug efflux pump subunit AcrA (membrane-fusion protein)
VRFIPTFEGEKRPLAAEQSVTVHVPVGAARNVLSVHKDAVTRRGSQSLVYVVEDATAELRSVQLGEAVGNRFEVRGGLQAGDTVVVRGNERLQPGDRVRVGGAPS